MFVFLTQGEDGGALQSTVPEEEDDINGGPGA